MARINIRELPDHIHQAISESAIKTIDPLKVKSARYCKATY